MKESINKISIIICTYNRAEILRECLQSLVEQTMPLENYEVIVVDNNSSDNTSEVIELFANKYSNFRLIKENQTGLSFARNTGYRNAKHDWISYIDDDATAHPNYVERALDTINKYDFKCIGGIYLPWFKYGTAAWLPQETISNIGRKPNDSVRLIENANACGGVMIFEKNVLEEVGGFPTNLGMTGKKIAYGEEDAVQIALRKKGYKIGLDEGLRIDHLVAKYKLDWRWHIQSAYGHGAAEIQVFQPKLKYPILFLIVGTIILPLLKIPYLVWKWLFKKNYYWQNVLIDLFGAAMHYKGRYDKYNEIRRKND